MCLNIASAASLHDAEEADGKSPDRRGDDMSNGGEYNRRHHAVMHAVLRKGHQMVSAVAVGSVVLGDKEDPAKTSMLNEGCAVDCAELEGDDATGGDALALCPQSQALAEPTSKKKQTSQPHPQ